MLDKTKDHDLAKAIVNRILSDDPKAKPCYLDSNNILWKYNSENVWEGKPAVYKTRTQVCWPEDLL